MDPAAVRVKTGQHLGIFDLWHIRPYNVKTFINQFFLFSPICIWGYLASGIDSPYSNSSNGENRRTLNLNTDQSEYCIYMLYIYIC